MSTRTLRERRRVSLTPGNFSMTRISVSGKLWAVNVAIDGARSIEIAGRIEHYGEYGLEEVIGYSYPRGSPFREAAVSCTVYDRWEDAIDDEGHKIVAQLRYYKATEFEGQRFDASFSLSIGASPDTFSILWELAGMALGASGVNVRIDLRTNASLLEHQEEPGGDSDLVPINVVDLSFSSKEAIQEINAAQGKRRDEASDTGQ